jgi:hypothetical protein
MIYSGAGQEDALRGAMHLSVRALAGAVVTATVAAACGGAVTEQVVGPGTVRCQIGVSTPPQTVPAVASSLTLNVDAARDCAWTATSETSWVQVAPPSGQGSGPITVAVAANADTRARSAAVAVNDTSVRINQDPMPCRFDFDPQHVRINPEGGATAIRVTTSDACEWRASIQASWVRLLTERGTGSGTVELEVSRNDGTLRSAAIAIAGQTVEVTQDSFPEAPGAPGAPAVPGVPGVPPPPPVTCTFAIDSDRASFRSSGGGGSVRVTTEPGCPWSAAAQVPWVTVAQPSGVGPGVLAYTVAAHTSTVSDRSGALTVAGKTLGISQQACALSLDPSNQTFGSPGGGGAVRVNTEPGCTWSASSGAAWVSLARSSGSGPDALPFQVAVHTSITEDRSTSITVSGRTHGIRQTAFRPEEISREGPLSDVSGSCPGFTFAVGGRVFVTDQHTKFDGGCDKIRNGARAFVRGTLLADGRVLATQVDIDD